MAGTRKLTVEILGDARSALKSFDDTSGGASKLADDFTNFGKKVAVGFAAVATGATIIGKQVVDAASDFNEVTSKTNVIFGDASQAVFDFAKTAAGSFGQSMSQALDGASTFGIFGKAAGLTGKDLAGFSTNLVGLASDMASFSNTTPQEAIDALGAALRGESEPIRRYGVMLNDAVLKQKAMELGIYDGNGALTSQQKILAAQAAIMDQTADAQGDFARTSDGLANQQRILSAQFENTKIRLGQALLPIALKVATVFADIIDKVAPLAERFLPVLADTLQKGAERIREIGSAIAKFLQPYIEKITNWIRENTDIVKVFFGVIAGAAVVAGVVALGASIAALFNPITLAIGALAAIAAGFYAAYTRSEEFREIIDAVVRFFSDTVIPAFQKGWEIAREAISKFVDGFKSRLDDMQTALQNIKTFIETVLGVIKNLWDRFGDEILGAVKRIFEGIKQSIEGILTVIKGVIDLFLGVLSGDWGRAFDGLKNIVSGAFDFFLGVVKTATAPIIAAFKAIPDAMVLAMEALWVVVGKVFNAIKALAETVFGAVATTIKTIFDGIVQGIVNVINGMLSFLENGLNFVIDGINHIIWSFEWVNGTADFPRIPRASLPRLADGGVVNAPTIALIGEAGPEAVVPLDRMDKMGQATTVVVNVAGSVTSERDLIESIRLGLLRSQQSGRQLVFNV